MLKTLRLSAKIKVLVFQTCTKNEYFSENQFKNRFCKNVILKTVFLQFCSTFWSAWPTFLVFWGTWGSLGGSEMSGFRWLQIASDSFNEGLGSKEGPGRLPGVILGGFGTILCWLLMYFGWFLVVYQLIFWIPEHFKTWALQDFRLQLKTGFQEWTSRLEFQF